MEQKSKTNFKRMWLIAMKEKFSFFGCMEVYVYTKDNTKGIMHSKRSAL